MGGACGTSSNLGALDWVIPMTFVFVVGVIGAMGFIAGMSFGAMNVLNKDRWACLQREDRSFVALGNWLIRGSGEITVHNVCVKWEVTR